MLSSGVNKVFLVGQVAQEPSKQRFLNLPNSITFILLTKEEIMKNNQVTEHFEYHTVVIPDEIPLHNINLKKDKLVYVKGKIQTIGWTDANNVRRYKTEVVASQIQLLLNVEVPVPVVTGEFQ